MADFPFTASPGDKALGPDGWYHILEWNGSWRRLCRQRPDDALPGGPPWPDDPDPTDDGSLSAAEIAACEEFNRALRAEEAAEAAAFAARARAAALPARPALATGAQHPDEDSGDVAVYEGEYAAVEAEVPPGQRADGWTVERRLLFLERLAEHGSILAAAEAAGVSRRSVYKLRPRAPAFAAAMDAAMRTSTEVLADTLFDRAIRGHQVPVFQGGELVGHRTVHHDQLGCYLLRVRDPLNYAPIDELERWKRHRSLEATALPAAGDSQTL